MIIDKLIINNDELQNKIIGLIENKKSGIVTYLNQHCYNVYSKDKKYRQLLGSAEIVYPDGVGMYFFLKYIAGKNPERIDASSINANLIKYLIEKNINMFLIGGNFESFVFSESSKARSFIKGYSNGYFSEDEKQNIFKIIGEMNTNLIFIGMGVPKQELLAKELLNHFNNSLIICVGNFFEFYFETIRRAPNFIRRIGMEWLFRLFTEPLRLWKRYIIGIPLFICRVLKYKIKSLNP